MESQHLKHDELMSLNTLLEEFQTFKKAQTDVQNKQALMYDELRVRLDRLELCDPGDRNNERVRDESHPRNRRNEQDNKDRDGNRAQIS